MPEKEKYTNVHTENSDQVEATPVNVAEVDEIILALPDKEAAILTGLLKLFMEMLGYFKGVAGL